MSYSCPCCHNLTLSEPPPGNYEICPVCYWEDDAAQFNDYDYQGGANSISLREARRNFEKYGACCENLRTEVRPPTPDEMPK